MELLIINPKSVKLLLALTVSFVAMLVQFIESWVWSPAWCLGLFIIILGIDFLSALFLSFKRGKGFDSAKSRKFAFQLFAQVAALGIAFNFPRFNELYGSAAVQPILDKFGGGLFMLMLSYNILSFLKNGVLLGGFTGSVPEFFKKYIDPHKNK